MLKLNNIFGIIYSFKERTWKCESFYIVLVLLRYSQYSKILHIRWDIWYFEKNPLFKFWISKIFYEEGSWKCWMPFWHPLKWSWQPTPVLLPGKSHGQRSPLGCSPWGRWESDTTEQLRIHFSLSCIGEGNGNPLQCSGLENPRDGGAWWAAVYGVAQSRTQLKRLSSSSSSKRSYFFLKTNTLI